MPELYQNLTPQLLEVWKHHADLQKAYPGVDTGCNIEVFLQWCNSYLPSEPHRFKFTIKIKDPEDIGERKGRKLIRIHSNKEEKSMWKEEEEK